MATINDYSLFAFLELPTDAVAGLIRGLTVAFPIDGTRRWFILNHPDQAEDGDAYLDIVLRRYVEVCKLLFDHGVETVLVPAFGGELLSRGPDYVQEMMGGMAQLAQAPMLLDFYREYGVRVRFYGDWRRQIAGVPGAAELAAAFDACPATQHAGTRRIFYGVYADDILVSLVDDLARSRRAAVEFTRDAIVARYYGEYVKPTDLYIGFGRPTVFDVPMLVTSQTDLYYLTVPSLDVDAHLFRSMVWDHFVGRWTQQEWDLSPKDFEALRAFYKAHHDQVLGLGEIDAKTGVWFAQGQRAIDEFRRQ